MTDSPPVCRTSYLYSRKLLYHPCSSTQSENNYWPRSIFVSNLSQQDQTYNRFQILQKRISNFKDHLKVRDIDVLLSVSSVVPSLVGMIVRRRHEDVRRHEGHDIFIFLPVHRSFREVNTNDFRLYFKSINDILSIWNWPFVKRICHV